MTGTFKGTFTGQCWKCLECGHRKQDCVNEEASAAKRQRTTEQSPLPPNPITQALHARAGAAAANKMQVGGVADAGVPAFASQALSATRPGHMGSLGAVTIPMIANLTMESEPAPPPVPDSEFIRPRRTTRATAIRRQVQEHRQESRFQGLQDDSDSEADAKTEAYIAEMEVAIGPPHIHLP